VDIQSIFTYVENKGRAKNIFESLFPFRDEILSIPHPIINDLNFNSQDTYSIIMDESWKLPFIFRTKENNITFVEDILVPHFTNSLILRILFNENFLLPQRVRSLGYILHYRIFKGPFIKTFEEELTQVCCLIQNFIKIIILKQSTTYLDYNTSDIVDELRLYLRSELLYYKDDTSMSLRGENESSNF